MKTFGGGGACLGSERGYLTIIFKVLLTWYSKFPVM